jgi:hypothetical protein
MSTAAPPVPSPGRVVKIMLPILAGCAVSLFLGVYGSVHDPTGQSIYSFVFTKTITMKVWTTSVIMVLVLFQLVSALRLFGKIRFPREVPAWLGKAHRASGTVAFLLAIPVAFHCLWALGFQTVDARHIVHSIAGCFFFGAFLTKVIVVESRSLPGWFLPAVGGSVFTALSLVWLSSALWFFATSGIQF